MDDAEFRCRATAVTGTELEAGLDPTDTAAFVTAVSFTGHEMFTGTPAPARLGRYRCRHGDTGGCTIPQGHRLAPCPRSSPPAGRPAGRLAG
ncbi:MAG: hypothetical protein ACK4PH_20175, partial [Aquincola tertiaricarbonis]